MAGEGRDDVDLPRADHRHPPGAAGAAEPGPGVTGVVGAAEPGAGAAGVAGAVEPSAGAAGTAEPGADAARPDGGPTTRTRSPSMRRRSISRRIDGRRRRACAKTEKERYIAHFGGVVAKARKAIADEKKEATLSVVREGLLGKPPF